MQRVAILQNQFKLSGRTHVMCELIGVLNELGIVPEVLSFTPAEVGATVGRYFGLPDLEYRYTRVAPVPVVRGYMWQVLAINQMTRARHADYDLVVNSNDTLYGLHQTANYLHYVYYASPGKTPYRYRTSFPRRIYGEIMKRLTLVSGRPRLDDAITTISEYSRQAILDLHPALDPAQVQIVYPPSYDEHAVVGDRVRVRRCISVGAFIAEKHQLHQLQIASQLTSLDFMIVGSVTSQRYYETCVAYKAQHGVDNVTLVPDMPYDDLQSALKESVFFIHTKQNEPFGIVTVQAIAAGCIPVVHDSAGQREIVPLPELRYTDVSQAVDILRNLLEKSDAELAALRHELQSHIQQFSSQTFRCQMRDILIQKLRLIDEQPARHPHHDG